MVLYVHLPGVAGLFLHLLSQKTKCTKTAGCSGIKLQMVEYTTAFKIKRFFSLFRQAVAGSEQDYTVGSIRKAVFLLAIPMILEMSMESVFALVDIFFVGKLGNAAVTTVVLPNPFLVSFIP